MGIKTEKNVQRYIQLSLNGDSQAFKWIIKQYQKRVYYTILQIVRNHEDADDALQETFIKVYTKLDTYNKRYPFYPWLYRIAVNTALNIQKKKSRQRELSIDDVESNGNGFQTNFMTAAPQVEDMEGRELATNLRNALNKIPDGQREVFLLRVNNGLSYQEISDELEISIGTVMSRLSRARSKLKDLLYEYVAINDVEV